MSLLKRLTSWLKPVDGTVGAPSGGTQPMPRDEPADRHVDQPPGVPDPGSDTGRDHDRDRGAGGAHRA